MYATKPLSYIMRKSMELIADALLRSNSALAVALDAPKIAPRLIPPPASTTLNTLGQWSRPALRLIFGVRPNSEETITNVSSSSP